MCGNVWYLQTGGLGLFNDSFRLQGKAVRGVSLRRCNAAPGLACKTIGLSIISSFPSFPLTPSAPRVEFAILCKINAARYTSASEGANAFLIVSTWLGWIACCCGAG